MYMHSCNHRTLYCIIMFVVMRKNLVLQFYDEVQSEVGPELGMCCINVGTCRVSGYCIASCIIYEGELKGTAL